MSGSSNGWTTLAGTDARLPQSRRRIVSVQTCLPSPASKLWTSTLPSMPSSASGSGTSTIVLDGCRSARPARTSSAASTQASGTQATCVITLVRW